MTALIVLRQMLKERVRAMLWWSVALVVLTVAVGASYPTVADTAADLEQLMDTLPQGLAEMLGAGGGFATAVGYLNSNLYANLLPVLLLVFGLGAAAWTVAGAEREGTLEPLLANPVRRAPVALGRFVGVAIALAVLTLVTTLVLVVFRAPFSLTDVGFGNLVAAGAGTYLLALLFTSVTYAVGAATGSKGAAIAAGAGLAAATYVIFALAAFVDVFERLEWLSPWQWFLDRSPLEHGWTWQSTVGPLLLTAAVAAAGTAWFTRRDLH